MGMIGGFWDSLEAEVELEWTAERSEFLLRVMKDYQTLLWRGNLWKIQKIFVEDHIPGGITARVILLRHRAGHALIETILAPDWFEREDDGKA